MSTKHGTAEKDIKVTLDYLFDKQNKQISVILGCSIDYEACDYDADDERSTAYGVIGVEQYNIGEESYSNPLAIIIYKVLKKNEMFDPVNGPDGLNEVVFPLDIKINYDLDEDFFEVKKIDEVKGGKLKDPNNNIEGEIIFDRDDNIIIKIKELKTNKEHEIFIKYENLNELAKNFVESLNEMENDVDYN